MSFLSQKLTRTSIVLLSAFAISAVLSVSFFGRLTNYNMLSVDQSISITEKPSPTFKGSLLASLPGYGSDMELSPNGQILAVVVKNIYLYKMQENNLSEIGVLKNKNTQNISRISWSPDSKSVASIDTSSEITLWDIKSLIPIKSFGDPNYQPISIAWSPNGKFIATTGDEQAEIPSYTETNVSAVRLWDALLGQGVTLFPYIFTHNINPADPFNIIIANGLAWSPDSTLLAVGGYGLNSAKALVNIIDIKTVCIIAYDNNFLQIPSSIQWASSGKIAVAGGDANIYSDPLTMNIESAFSAILPTNAVSLSWNNKGNRLAVVSSTLPVGQSPINAQIDVYNPFTQRSLFEGYLDKSAISVAWLTSQQSIVTLETDQNTTDIRVWNLKNYITENDNNVTVTPYSTSIITPTMPFMEPLQSNLTLSALCVEAGTLGYNEWRVTNPNATTVTFVWKLNNSTQNQLGVLFVAGEKLVNTTTFYSRSESVTDTVSIYVDGKLQDSKISNRDVCSAPTVSPTSSPYPTPLIQPLQLHMLCSSIAGQVFWQIVNTNPFDITFNWSILSAQLTGTGIVPAQHNQVPGSFIIETKKFVPTVTMQIYTEGVFQVSNDNGSLCFPSNNPTPNVRE